MSTTPATINAVRHNPAPQTQNLVLRDQPPMGFRNREEGAFKAALGEFVVDMDFSSQRAVSIEQRTVSIEFDALPSIRSRMGIVESLLTSSQGLLQLFRIADPGFAQTCCRSHTAMRHSSPPCDLKHSRSPVTGRQ
jgi:hypothetical protein